MSLLPSKLWKVVLKDKITPRRDVQPVASVKEEDQVRISSLDPDPADMKEEQEPVSLSPVPMKDEDEPESSRLHQNTESPASSPSGPMKTEEPDTALEPDTASEPDILQVLVGEDEQQNWHPDLDQEAQRHPHIKEEEEEFQLAHVCVQSDDEEKLQLSQLHQSHTVNVEDCGELEEPGVPGPGRLPHRGDEESDFPPCGNSDDGKDAGAPRSNDPGEKPYSCSECRRSFALKTTLTEHTRIHTGQKPYSCSFCHRAFTLRTTLRGHVRIHTGQRPYSCSVCNKSFTQRANLTKHMILHTGVRPYSCSLCPKSFTQKTNLMEHMKVHTGVKLHSCSVCSKSFAQNTNLRRHLRTHTGESPFSCSTCKKSFTQKITLTRHMTIHTGQKLFSCTFCAKGFNRRSQLTNHKCVEVLKSIPGKKNWTRTV